jgi:hypothetical protein
MSTPRIIRAAQTLLHQVSRMSRTLTKRFMSWLLRGLLMLGKQPNGSKAGFVLPVTVLLLLVVTLTVGAIGFRTFTRTQQTIGERQQRVIYNAATPAIDRAKAKLEFLFDGNRDSRAGQVAPDNLLLSKMLNDGIDVSLHPSGVDPYTITDANAARSETRIDINNDGKLDNAWRYKADTNGDGQDDATVAYSIVFTKPPKATPDPLADMRDNVAGKGILDRAAKLQIRNAPLSDATKTNSCSSQANTAANTTTDPNPGWFQDSVRNNVLRKNFQVDVYVLPDSPNGAVATLEFQQDRQANQGFKWAAWFRNDLEIFPGPQFNWNGAMHTEGNLVVGSSAFRGYMISSYASCFYTQDASEITSADFAGDAKHGPFQGQFIAGTIKNNAFEGTPTFDLWNGSNIVPITDRPMGSGADSVLGRNGLKPVDFALDPVTLQTEDASVSRNPAIANPAVERDPAWDTRELFLTGRMKNLAQDTPYLDDTFRADNRWGPKPRWGPKRLDIEGMGEEIVGNVVLTKDGPPPGAPNEDVGLDGYWERRARREGLRLIVGQRLELGDPMGWGGTAPTSLDETDFVDVKKEPLNPWLGCAASNATRCNEARQRKALWDNLAAVQATAVYHANYNAGDDPDFPLACIATTVHPGTAGTLDKSATFENLAFGLPNATIPGYTNSASPRIISDFFRGRGTNGWEYDVPPLASFTTANSPLRIALRNLAQFAGDPQGGTPSFQPPPADGVTHPHPLMSMWGDFSVLRRVISRMEDEGISYAALSPADKTTLHTAGCTLGMLAYNLDYLEKIPKVGVDTLAPNTITTLAPTLIGLPNLPPTDPKFGQGLRGYIRLIDAAISNKINGTVVPDSDPLLASVPLSIKEIKEGPDGMASMAWDPTRSDNPETYVRLLERWRDLPTTSAAQKTEMTNIIYLAQLLITREQVARDRAFGFYGGYGIKKNPPTEMRGNLYSVPDRTLVSSIAPLGECSTWITRNPTTGLPITDGKPREELSRLCSIRPRYPILYSLFPAQPNQASPNPDIEASYVAAGTSNGFQNHGDLSDSTSVANQQLYVRDAIGNTSSYGSYIKDNANAGVVYKVVRPSLVATSPRQLAAASMGGATAWKLPTLLGTNGSTPNSNSLNLIKVCATAPCSQPQSSANRAPATNSVRYRIPFKDAGLFNGRELMSVRTLDLDLDLMRQNTTPASDSWLPKSGVIYAFREDAVSEAHIARRKLDNWANCATPAALLSGSLQNNDNCRMRTTDNAITNSYDPPLSPLGITPKPVDFFADPDRRPHGFRLRNGASLNRTGDDGLGLSFITDNPAYVQGPFNLHRAFGQTSTDRANGLEEFVTKLSDNFSNFYTRNASDDTFAVKGSDQWRPSEVLADAVTPLSTNFCDGSIEDSFTSNGSNGTLPTSTFLQTRYGCTSDNNNGITSYQNQSRTRDTVTPVNQIRWMRTNIADSFWPAQATTVNPDPPIEGESPIFIHASGNPQTIKESYYGSASPGRYDALSGGRELITAVDGTQMNMIMVSGIVPSRSGQSYGGLHNFPRFLENWGGKKLFMSGAFLQLNFSTYGTAPFDQENWQTTDSAPTTGTEWIAYYSPPLRRWGYDVGLLKAAPGPVARRFRFSVPTRSEFYSEPAATDPYIKNLCRSIPGNSANCP